MNDKQDRFLEAAAYVSPAIYMALRQTPKAVREKAQEIRLRLGGPVTVCCHDRSYYLTTTGVSDRYDVPDLVCASGQDLRETVTAMCSYSVYTHQNELNDGFISLRGGHRAGICGTAVLSGRSITSIRDISSINLRVARQLTGCAQELMEKVSDRLEEGLLLAGAPSSGKTTLLRDLIRILSRSGRRVAVVDERGEIGAAWRGIRENDLGPNCDLLNGYPKSLGIMHAIRGLSPEFIVCDEVGGEDDCHALEQGLHAGVAFVATIHAARRADLLRREPIQRLLRTGAFETVALLGSRNKPGKIHEIDKAGDLLDRDHRCDVAGYGRDGGWIHAVEPSRPAG